MVIKNYPSIRFRQPSSNFCTHLHLHTRMHSSRMRTACSLTISRSIYQGRGHACHACTPPPHMPPAMHVPCHACPPCHTYPLPCMPPPHMPPCHACPPAMHTPCHACPPPCTPCHVPLLPHTPPMHAPLGMHVPTTHTTPATHAPLPHIPCCHAHPPAMHAPPHCGQNSWHTLLKILPCPNFVAGGKKHLHRQIGERQMLKLVACRGSFCDIKG